MAILRYDYEHDHYLAQKLWAETLHDEAVKRFEAAYRDCPTEYQTLFDENAKPYRSVKQRIKDFIGRLF